MTLNYQQLNEVLKQARSVSGGSEVHGFASGWIASGSNWSSAQDSFIETFQLQPGTALSEAMVGLASQIETGLADVDFGFELLLPGDDAGINNRRQALSEWCRGFLTGFGLTGRFRDAELSEEVRELFKDFAQIAQVDEDMPEDEENESDLTEITEYVRMGAIMSFTDCASKAVH
jgi:uncharacterized protein YgfB (UPF0149 family)